MKFEKIENKKKNRKSPYDVKMRHERGAKISPRIFADCDNSSASAVNSLIFLNSTIYGKKLMSIIHIFV